MLLSVDVGSERAIYAQIADSVRRAVACGELLVGERLPSASEVAIGLGVNKHTVLHAYQQLRDEGLIDLRRGRGAVVTQLAGEIVTLRQDAKRIAERARALGISGQTLAALFDDRATPSSLPAELAAESAIELVAEPATELPAQAAAEPAARVAAPAPAPLPVMSTLPTLPALPTSPRTGARLA